MDENVRIENRPLLSEEEEQLSFPTPRARVFRDDGFDGSRIDYEKTLDIIGYGRFHYTLLALCGWALSSDAIEVLSISFILPPATCDLHLSSGEKGWLNAIIFLGMMIGGYLWGTLADINGRRAVLLWSLTVNGLGGLASSFAQSFPVFLIFRFISGIGVGGSLPVVFAYYTEFQPKAKRGSMISFLATFWMGGNIIAAGLAWLVIPFHIGFVYSGFLYNSWRIYLSLCTLPSITSALMFILMPESPKYLLSVNKNERAWAVLSRIYSSTNPGNRSLDEFIDQVRDYDENDRSDEVCRQQIPPQQNNKFKKQCLDFLGRSLELYKAPLTKISVVMTVIMFTLSFGYYGLFLWFPELFNRIEKYGGSPCSLGKVNTTAEALTLKNCDSANVTNNKIYLESFLTAVSNLPGNILTILLIDRIGRKIILAVAMLISGASVFFIALLHNATQSLIMSCVFSGISVMGWNAVDVLMAELYPTKLRSTASGLLMIVGRTASILGNVAFGQLVDAYCLIPMFLVAGMLTVGGLIAFKLPNTTGTDLQ